MSWLRNALATSVGKKFVMAITGLLLCGFLVVHLGGNLLLFVGASEYNKYAHALHEQKVLLAVAEVGLFALFVAHIVIALQVSAENRTARKVNYAVKQSKQTGRYMMEPLRPDLWMLISGIVVLGFLILHLIDFRFELRPDIKYLDASGQDLQPFDKARTLLSTSNVITIVGYAMGSFFLWAHLAHGFQSAFQTLGINHPKYTPLIKLVGLLFAITMGVGFASFPVIWGPSQGGTPSNQSRPAVSGTAPDSVGEDTPRNHTPPQGTLEGVDDPNAIRFDFQDR